MQTWWNKPELTAAAVFAPRFSAVAIVAAGLFAAVLVPSLATAAPTPVIRSVEIDRANVFDTELAKHPWFLLRWGNAFHVRTAESVIFSRVLYRPGDTLDSLRLIETERNLRALGFIGEVRTSLLYNPDSSEVRVHLSTKDQWSTFVQPMLSSSGGDSKVGVAVQEQNVLGTGNELLGEYRVTAGRPGFRLYAWAPVFLRPHLNAALDWRGDENVRSLTAEVWRPAYSLEEPYSWSLSTAVVHGTFSQYSSGRPLYVYHLREDVQTASFTRNLGGTLRPRFTVQLSRREYLYNWPPATNPFRRYIPESAVTFNLTAGPSIGHYRYIRTTLLDNFGNVEDRVLGAWAGITGTRAFDILRTDQVHSSLDFSSGTAWRWGELYGSAAFNFDSRYEHRPVNVLYRPRLTLLWRAPGRTVTALRLQSTLVSRPALSWNPALGGDLGLRGYQTYALTGQNTVAVNLEERWFAPFTCLTVAPGAVAFLDAGQVWATRSIYRRQTWKPDAGVGLRLGLTRVPGFEVLRLDFAWPLHDPGFLLSFGTGMYFTL